MLLQDSRRAQRRSDDGELVPLEDQDRARWDRAAIAAGLSSLDSAAAGAGPYLAQARIAAAHASAPSWSETDWHAVLAGYDELLGYLESPVVRVNRAVAVGFAHGFPAGLAALDEVAADPRLAGTHLVGATRAELLRRAGRPREAAEHYRAALTLVGNDEARRFLARRLAEVETDR